MKNLVILLLAAAAVGIVITRVTEPEAKPQNAPAPAGDTALARAESADEAIPSPEPETAAAPTPEGPPAAALAVPSQPRVPPEPQGDKGVANASEGSGDPARPTPVDTRLERGRELFESGERIEARKVLTELYLDSEGEEQDEAREVLRQINAELVFNPRVTAGATIHSVKPGETLTKIGKQYSVNWRMIARLNDMRPDGMLKVGQELKVLTGKPRVLVDLSEFRLALLFDGVFIKEYLVGIGKDDCTPTGEFVVDNLLVRPRWYAPDGRVIEYGEEDHLLGERWIGFADQPGASGLGIHGTKGNSGIGEKCSNGCIRMRNEDVVELYDFMTPGTKVLIEE
ncbi:MAG: L,D-transpeptidase family protein [Candidatus Brocadiia bacterium]